MSCPTPLFDNLSRFQDTKIDPAVIFNQQDFDHAKEFIYSYRGSEATFNAYRREIERYLHWCWGTKQKSLKDIKRAEFEEFVEFCRKPPLEWIGTQNYRRFSTEGGLLKPNANWRPFVITISKTARQKGEEPDPRKYAPSQKALQAIFSILGSFYTYLLNEEYLETNPVRQVRQKSKFLRKQQSSQVIRRLSELQWAYVIETAEKAANAKPEQERTLFIMNALYGMYLRISELAASERWEPQMGDFQKDQDGHWWFTTVGKGNKERMITVSDAMLNALKRYRESLGLTALPAPGDTIPLIAKNTGTGAITSTRRIRIIVQSCFDHAVERLRADGFNEEADSLQSATVHWLRHTGISDDVKHRPREHVRDDAGHGSSAITDRYIDIELRERHASGRKKVIKPE